MSCSTQLVKQIWISIESFHLNIPPRAFWFFLLFLGVKSHETLQASPSEVFSFHFPSMRSNPFLCCPFCSISGKIFPSTGQLWWGCLCGWFCGLILVYPCSLPTKENKNNQIDPTNWLLSIIRKIFVLEHKHAKIPDPIQLLQGWCHALVYLLCEAAGVAHQWGHFQGEH